MYIPKGYEQINAYNGFRRPTGKVTDSILNNYFERCLYERLTSTIDFKIPQNWSLSYFTWVLFSCGFVGIIPSDEYGVIPQYAALTGYDIFYNPTTLTVQQPLVSYTGTLHENCEVIRLTPDWTGCGDIIAHYADKLATISTSIDMSLINSRLAYFIAAKNKQAAETFKTLLKAISSGEPAVFFDQKLLDDAASIPWQEFHNNVKECYITPELLDNYETILHQFDNEVGIPNVSEKKERMLTDEISIQNSDSCARISTWKKMLDESIENVNAMFPELNISYSIPMLDSMQPSDQEESEVAEDE